MQTRHCMLMMIEAMIFLSISPAYADGDLSKEELAKVAQNPIANMISLPFQNNTNTGIGPDNKTQNILNIQPVIPFSVTEDWTVITRTILPVISQPGPYTNGEGRVDGLGDTSFTAFLSPSKGEVTWGLGPTLLLPTATDNTLGSDKWGAGISAVALYMPGRWVIGSLVSNVWSFAGSGANDINSTTIQPFINYNFDHGWYLSTVPIITANWEADSGNQWTVPLGGGIGKIIKFGKLPVNLQVHAYYNVVTPDNGPDWQIRTQLQLLFPK